MEILSYVGRGSFNIVFFVNYCHKPAILKIFMPRRYSGGAVTDAPCDFVYDFEVEELENQIIINSIQLSVPAQTSCYHSMLEEYNKSNARLINLLYSEELNSFIPKPYLENALYFIPTDKEARQKWYHSTVISECIMLFAYDSFNSVEDEINQNTDIIEKLQLIQSIAGIMNGLYKNNPQMLMLDIKPENFLYKSHKNIKSADNYKILDWDSVVDLNHSEFPSGVKIYSSAGYAPYEVREAMYHKSINASSCVYILSVCLYQALFFSSASTEEEKQNLMLFFKPAGEFSAVEYPPNITEYFQKIGVTSGFINRFYKMMECCYTTDLSKRYAEKDNKSAFEQFADDIQTLINIHIKKGITPEVLLDCAIEQAAQAELPDGFDEALFAGAVTQ